MESDETHHSPIRDHPDHHRTPSPFFRLCPQLKDMPAIRTELDDGQDLLPSRIVRAQLHLIGCCRIEAECEDGGIWRLISAEMGRVDIDVVQV